MTQQIIMLVLTIFIVVELFFFSVMVSSLSKGDSAGYEYGSGLSFPLDSYFYLVLELFLFLVSVLDICMTECDSVSYKYEWPFCSASHAD